MIKNHLREKLISVCADFSKQSLISVIEDCGYDIDKCTFYAVKDGTTSLKYGDEILLSYKQPIVEKTETGYIYKFEVL